MADTDLPTPHGAAALTHTGVIRASGADAAAFLHGQLTNDITGLGADEARLAAYCSAKGRMLASFVGFRHPVAASAGDATAASASEIWLVCRADVMAATVKRLRMFVLRAKARLDEGGTDVAVLGLAGASAAAWLAGQAPEAAVMKPWSRRTLGDASLVRLPDGAGEPRWLWAGPAGPAGAVLQALPHLPLPDWDWLEVRSGVSPVVAATVEAFVPQMLNYELIGGINFQKGCYPGQEIVARSQYRGTIKRRAVIVHADAPMAPGQEVHWSGDAAQPSGLVAIAAPAPGGGHDALVELKLAALEGGSLHLGSPAGPSLAPLPLPYEVPRESAAA
jgi:hypothetical protein